MHCFHVFGLPLFVRKTGNVIFDLLEEAMGTICPQREHSLFYTCYDGARNMIVRVRGIVNRFALRSAAVGHKLIRFGAVLTSSIFSSRSS